MVTSSLMSAAAETLGVAADDPSIVNGVRWARNWWSLLVEAEVNVVHHWWLVGFHDDGRQQALINAVRDQPGFHATRRLYALGQYSRFVRPGWQRVDATPQPYDDVYLSAFRHPTDGRFAFVLVNEADAPREVTFTFDGFEAASLTPTRTSDEEALETLADVPGGAGFTTTLAPLSITTFTGRDAGTVSLDERTGAEMLVVAGGDGTVSEVVDALAPDPDGVVLGIFTERDYLRRIVLQGRTSKETAIEEVMTSEVIAVTPDYEVEDCLSVMTQNKCRHLPVMDDGELSGIISIGDCVKQLHQHARTRLDDLTQYVQGRYPG